MDYQFGSEKNIKLPVTDFEDAIDCSKRHDLSSLFGDRGLMREAYLGSFVAQLLKCGIVKIVSVSVGKHRINCCVKN